VAAFEEALGVHAGDDRGRADHLPRRRVPRLRLRARRRDRQPLPPLRQAGGRRRDRGGDPWDCLRLCSRTRTRAT
jgi:hypothetical protein